MESREGRESTTKKQSRTGRVTAVECLASDDTLSDFGAGKCLGRGFVMANSPSSCELLLDRRIGPHRAIHSPSSWLGSCMWESDAAPDFQAQ